MICNRNSGFIMCRSTLPLYDRLFSKHSRFQESNIIIKQHIGGSISSYIGIKQGLRLSGNFIKIGN